MNKPAIAIIEDEIPAARLLHSMIARLRPEWDITVIPGSVEEATEWFATHPHPALLFLDIQLADGNSFDFLSAAHPSSTIIFTTARRKHCTHRNNYNYRYCFFHHFSPISHTTFRFYPQVQNTQDVQADACSANVIITIICHQTF